MLDHVDTAIRRSARLSDVHVPSRTTVNLFNPDADARIDDVSRTEARSRGLTLYTSGRLSVLDKLYVDKLGRPVVLRYASNSLTPGEARLANRLHAARKAGAA